MTDPVTVTFQAEEILIRTPAEHFINAKKYDMEIQVLHTAVMGEVQYQAILSFLYSQESGAVRNVFNKIDVMNLPNKKLNLQPDILKEKLHVFDFLFDDSDDV